MYSMLNIKEYVANKKAEIKREVSTFSKPIKLIIVQVNDDPASNSYIKGKIKDLDEVGIACEHIKLPETTSEKALLKLIEKLNKSKSVDGFIVQMPLPKHIDEELVKLAVSPLKDVDGFNALSRYVPATPNGIINYLVDNNYPFEGKNAVVIGRSNIVGKPLAQELTKKNMNVTLLHSKTTEEDKKFYIEHADLICVAVGKPEFLKNTYKFKKDCVIFDIGINRVDGKLVGDVASDVEVAFKSPVPGGVGLLTRLALLLNLLEVYKDGI